MASLRSSTFGSSVKTQHDTESAGDIASALSQFAANAPTPVREEVPFGRSYRLRDVAIILASFAVAMGLLDSEGLLTWARRLEVGRVQGALTSALTPLRAAAEAVGLTAPRRILLGLADRVGAALGASEDPLFVEAWRTGPEAAPHPEPIVPEAAAVLPQPEPPAATAVSPPTSGAAVLLIGDSLLAGSLGTAITRALSSDPRFRVVSAVQSATGLSRPEVFDWAAVAPPLLEREQPSYVVCSFGANDGTAIRQGERLLEFEEGPWHSVYRARVIQMMRRLAGTNTRVLWLGLPPMRSERLADRGQVLNRLYAEAARTVPRVEFLDVTMLLSDHRGDFTTFANDPSGRLVRLRMDDGVHYSPAGARAVSRWVVDWLRERQRMGAPAHAK